MLTAAARNWRFCVMQKHVWCKENWFFGTIFVLQTPTSLAAKRFVRNVSSHRGKISDIQ
jgi:hypothetical protein